MTAPATRHYPLFKEYVRAVTKDLIERGKIRRKHGQSVDTVIQHEIQTVIAEVTGDVRALAIELGVTAVTSGVTLLELIVRQTTDRAVSAGVDSIFELLANSVNGKRR